MTLDIRVAEADAGAGLLLVTALEQELRGLYPGYSFDGPGMPQVAPANFTSPDGLFVVGWLGGDAVCCGGLKRHSAEACEIKRMYVVPECRGHGFGRALLDHLEHEARALGYVFARLGTGDCQMAARRMYERAGYVSGEPFAGNPFHAFSGEKRLDM